MGRREVPTRLPAAPATLRAALCVVVVVLCWASSITYGFSFSFMHDLGLAYSQGETVHVLAKSVTSRSKIVPLRWSSVFPCAASLSQSTLPPSRRSIGQVLMGETLEDSGIRLKVLTDMKCVLICSARFNTAEREQYEKRILGRYRAHLVLDGLPALEAPSVDGEHRRIRTGFPLGNFSRAVATGIIEAYNHLHLIVSYYPITSADSLTVRIVQFEVQPRSVYHTGELGGDGTCTFPAVLKPQITPMESIRFSYSVEWVVSTTPWKTRWDNYVDDNSHESKARWHSIVNVLSLVLLQSVLLWYILVRSVRRDILSYNEEDLLGDREDSGWKLVHGDVFRPPRGAVFLSVLVGNGMQIMCMVIASLLFAVAGMLSHDSRGTLASLLVMLFVLFSSVNGLVTASLIKLLRRRSWQAIFLTSIALPGSNISIPAKINAIPRTIPPQPWYMKGVFSYVALGIVPLAASYVELQSIFSSVWLGVAYRMLSFLLAAFVLVLVIVAQVSIFSTYNQLSLLNYHWWWRSFFVSASYGAWLMLYCVLYYWFISVVKGFLGMILFFGYMGLACVTVALMFGAVGFLASLVFVRILFASVKAD
ncbi:Endomembrane protein 70 family protein [Leishmania donovani]|uniref:Transmembrane 9 superfamily member n=1 Tax=Leishmania donovani TaxID=5661 RepID=A0A504XCT0_LEIDO|nr:Endomembrane protein 70 family protein [Leishmania donovani]